MTSASSSLDVLLTLTTAVGRAGNIERIYDAALDAIEQGLHVARASILLFDADGVMRFKAWRGISDAYRRAVEGHTPWTPGARDAAPLCVGDVTDDAGLATYDATFRAEGIRALAFIPLVTDGGVCGKFMLYYGEPHTFSDTELQLASVIAAQVAFAVQRLRAQAERTRADALKREADEHLRAVIDRTPECVKVVAADGSLLEMNAAGLQMVEASSWEAVAGHSVFELIAPDFRDRYREFHDRICSGERGTFEFDIIGLAGTRRTLETHAVPLRAPDGSIRHLAITRDVTARRKAQDALVASEALFRQLADVLPELIWTTGPDGQATYFNARWYGYTGLPPGSFDRDAWRSAMHPEDRAAALDAWARSFATGEPFQCELRLREAHTRAYRWHLARAVPVRGERGDIASWVGSSTDIDDQKRVERTSRFLAAASRTLATLVDYQTALERVAELAVPDFADWCAVDVAEEGGTLRRLALCHADRAKVELAFELERKYPPHLDSPHGARRVMRTGEPEMMTEIPEALIEQMAHDAGHLTAIRAFGPRSYISVPLVGPDRPIGVITFIATEDSGRRYDSQDLAVAQELAHRAGIAIENARLYSDLQAAARQKDEFLAVLAHELRNPLAPIRTALQLVEIAGDDAARRTRACGVMDRQLRQLVRLVDDLLDVSRITRGLIELQRQPVELAAVLQSAIETSRPMLEANAHELTVTYPREPILLDADPTRLSQVFANVLNNAAKYTPRGGHVTLAAEADEGQVTIRVRDTGIGIPPAMLTRVFSMFVQVDRSFERSSGGLGIGLTLVKRLVDMHGGTVEARSDGPGTGSEFIVRLPALGVADGAADRSSRGTRLIPGDTSRRILVADDNEDAAACLAEALRLMGHEVRTVHDGAAAVALSGDYRPELLLLDVGMPQMDGYEAARRIRTALGDSAFIVAVTGWGQREDQQRSRDAGFDRHLVKPVDIGDVSALIEGLPTRSGPPVRPSA